MTERKLCGNCDYQKLVGVSIACQRCFNKSLWKPRSKTMTEEMQEKWALKTNLDDALDLIDAYKKRVADLEAQIEKMKCCYNCSKWYDGECEESPKSKTFFCADFKCDNWEFADD